MSDISTSDLACYEQSSDYLWLKLAVSPDHPWQDNNSGLTVVGFGSYHYLMVLISDLDMLKQ